MSDWIWDCPEGGEKVITPQAGQTVLDALLGQQVKVGHSCRAGACQSCLVQARSGKAPERAQAGLKASLVEQGYFLACLCPAEAVAGARLGPPGAGTRVKARIAGTEYLSPTVLRVTLAAAEPLGHRAGQYLTLVRKDGLARSYSIASPGHASLLELHVRLIPGGAMSGWLAGTSALGAEVEVQGPAGNCFYTNDSPDRKMLLAGTGTGLAPLIGILREALEQNHRGEIWLYHGALRREGLYLSEELQRMAPVHYVPAVLDEDGPLVERLLRDHPNPAGARAYVCGDPAIVTLLRKRLFLAGMSNRDIFSDAFLPSSPSA